MIADLGFDVLFEKKHALEACNKLFFRFGNRYDFDNIRISLFQKQGKLSDRFGIQKKAWMTGKKHLCAACMNFFDKGALFLNNTFVCNDLFGISMCEGVFVLAMKTVFGLWFLAYPHRLRLPQRR